jgi:hypothetical protein
VPCSPPLPSPHRRRHRRHHHHHQPPPLLDRWTEIVRWRELGRGREGERKRVGGGRACHGEEPTDELMQLERRWLVSMVTEAGFGHHARPRCRNCIGRGGRTTTTDGLEGEQKSTQRGRRSGWEGGRCDQELRPPPLAWRRRRRGPRWSELGQGEGPPAMASKNGGREEGGAAGSGNRELRAAAGGSGGVSLGRVWRVKAVFIRWLDSWMHLGRRFPLQMRTPLCRAF